MDEADPGKNGTYRAAKAAVIILSALLVLAVLGVVAGFIRQARIYQAGRAAITAPAMSAALALPSAAAPEAAVPPISITLAPGAHIISASLESGKLVLRVQTAEGDEVDVLDLDSGRLAARVKDGAPQGAQK